MPAGDEWTADGFAAAIELGLVGPGCEAAGVALTVNKVTRFRQVQTLELSDHRRRTNPAEFGTKPNRHREDIAPPDLPACQT